MPGCACRAFITIKEDGAVSNVSFAGFVSSRHPAIDLKGNEEEPCRKACLEAVKSIHFQSLPVAVPHGSDTFLIEPRNSIFSPDSKYHALMTDDVINSDKKP